MDKEGRSNALAAILNMCEVDPDAALAFLEETVAKHPEAQSDPFYMFAKAMAYGSKGLFQRARRTAEADFSTFDGQELRDDLGVTDADLNYLEAALQEIREMEVVRLGSLRLFGTEEDRLGERKVDAMATVVERCRPGRVQEILGKTKLYYFGAKRVFRHDECEITQGEFAVFRNIFFTSRDIARSAILRYDYTDERGRRNVIVALYKEPTVFSDRGEQSPLAGLVRLYDDGTFRDDDSSFFRQLFG